MEEHFLKCGADTCSEKGFGSECDPKLRYGKSHREAIWQSSESRFSKRCCGTDGDWPIPAVTGVLLKLRREDVPVAGRDSSRCLRRCADDVSQRDDTQPRRGGGEVSRRRGEPCTRNIQRVGHCSSQAPPVHYKGRVKLFPKGRIQKMAGLSCDAVVGDWLEKRETALWVATVVSVYLRPCENHSLARGSTVNRVLILPSSLANHCAVGARSASKNNKIEEAALLNDSRMLCLGNAQLL